jgi:hypothetical protein
LALAALGHRSEVQTLRREELLFLRMFVLLQEVRGLFAQAILTLAVVLVELVLTEI